MSLIIQGIDIPIEGEALIIEINSSGDVRAYSTIPMVIDHDIRAIQIPKGHGAIKDIDTFLKDKCLTEYIENDVFNKKYTYTISTVAIYNAPTILEAEE